ncbi:MAG: ATP phosphoribosyltransferase regulatory subunit [Lachnospiraceae bacterium]|nr:ATP phosphoribosyltransferase regulatory subunit [Lachnospiraceae bacterium]
MKYDRILHTPEGVRDIYGEECARKHILETALHAKMKLYGFVDIQTPTLEYFDVFSAERGTFAAKDMYKLFDREGNTLVLRPDITPSVARCVAKYFKDDPAPHRLCYTGNVFINSSEHQGKAKEITQMGAELTGDGSVVADAEILALTVECLLASGLSEFQVEVGEVGFFKAVVEEAGIKADDLEEMMLLINEKNAFGLEDFLDRVELKADLKGIFAKLPTMFGSVDKLSEFKNMTRNRSAVAAIERLEKIYELMKLYGYEKYISFDLGMLSQFGYYSGIIFNAYTYEIGDSLISGGRYDNLVGQFGCDTPAVGMAVFVDRLLTAMIRQDIAIEAGQTVERVTSAEDGFKESLMKVIDMRKNGSMARIDIV